MCGKRLVVLLALAALLGSTFGCSPFRNQQPATATPDAKSIARTQSAYATSTTATSGPPTATLSPSRTPAPVATPTIPESAMLPGGTLPPTPSLTHVDGTCLLHQIPASWGSAFLKGAVAVVPDETLVPIAVSTDGKHLFAGDYTPSSRRFIEIDTSTGNRRTIMIFHGSQDQVAGANFDGRWLVWSVGHSFSNLSDWSLYAWDSQTNQVIDVAQVQRVNGKPIDGPFVMPVVSHGLMAWTQSTPGGNTELHLYTLASRTARVIDRNHPGAPIFAWPLMIWEEPRGNLTPSPGTRPDAKLTVANAMTGKRLPTPAVLANVQPWYLVGAPGMVAWVELDRRTIWLWNVGTPQPERIYVAPENEYAEFPSFGNHVLAWAGESAMYVYDLRAKGPVVQVTPQYGDVFANGSALVVSYNIRGTKNPNGDRVIVVDYDKLLPPPPCTS